MTESKENLFSRQEEWDFYTEALIDCLVSLFDHQPQEAAKELQEWLAAATQPEMLHWTRMWMDAAAQKPDTTRFAIDCATRLHELRAGAPPSLRKS